MKKRYSLGLIIIIAFALSYFVKLGGYTDNHVILSTLLAVLLGFYFRKISSKEW